VSRSFHTVVFSHGKETGPWGSKITAMAATARELNLAVESVDYQGIEDPTKRVDKLLEAGSTMQGSMVLVGSSMGGHVSAAAARRLQARGLFLLAPAFYMRGFEAYTPQDVDCPTGPCYISWSPIIACRIKSRTFAGCCATFSSR
jgi:pimeloyl-ACP methyl ester carboxylesterase